MMRSPSSVLIVRTYGWHAPILDPLAARLEGRCEVAVRSLSALQEGWRPERVPDLIVVADAGTAWVLRDILPEPFVALHVGHGLISKNIPRDLYGAADYVCVASQTIADRLTALGAAPRRRFFATGLIQSDPLFRLPLGIGARVPGCAVSIVYAPTWNPTLSSAPMLGDRLLSCLRGPDDGIGIAIKPHPHIAVSAPAWIETWRLLAERHPNVVLHPPEADLIPVMLGADLMVSDASSAIFHFLALNRPIVLIDNPERFTEPGCYDPGGIEWQWRDVGTCVERVDDLRDAVATALDRPHALEPQRLARRAALFGDLTDGGACGRVADVVGRILEGRA